MITISDYANRDESLTVYTPAPDAKGLVFRAEDESDVVDVYLDRAAAVRLARAMCAHLGIEVAPEPDGLEDLDPEKHMVYSEKHGPANVVMMPRIDGTIRPVVDGAKHTAWSCMDPSMPEDLRGLREAGYYRVERPKEWRRV